MWGACFQQSPACDPISNACCESLMLSLLTLLLSFAVLAGGWSLARPLADVPSSHPTLLKKRRRFGCGAAWRRLLCSKHLPVRLDLLCDGSFKILTLREGIRSDPIGGAFCSGSACCVGTPNGAGGCCAMGTTVCDTINCCAAGQTCQVRGFVLCAVWFCGSCRVVSNRAMVTWVLTLSPPRHHHQPSPPNQTKTERHLLCRRCLRHSVLSSTGSTCGPNNVCTNGWGPWPPPPWPWGGRRR
jgi:hypothetical protein